MITSTFLRWLGCATDAPPDEVDWDTLAPVLESRCAGCHQPGGAGPMDLTTAASAAEWAESMAVATAARTMPPWLVRSDGSCGTFAASEALTDEQVALFARWAEAGAPPGSGRPLDPPRPPTLDRVDVELATPLDWPVPEGDVFAPTDEYRCYELPNPSDQDWFFTGSEVLPGDPAIVHHVLLMVVDPEGYGWDERTNSEVMADLEDDDPRPGWDCLGTVGGTARERGMPIEWAPGQGAVTLPDGLGVRVRPQDRLVAQVHYSMPSVDLRGRSDSTTIHLRTSDQVDREAYFAIPDKFVESVFSLPPDVLPAGQESVSYTWEMDADELEFYAYQEVPRDAYELLAVLPHMHQRGRTISLHVERPGRDECLVDVPRWDFAWQRMYTYATPIPLAPGDRLVVECTYDTRDATSDVTPGWGTGTEMCLMGMLVTTE